MAGPIESGLRPQRIEYHRETTRGVPVTDPAWLSFANEVQYYGPTPEMNIFRLDQYGALDPAAYEPGPEAHAFTIRYPMQEWFKTSGGLVLNPAQDGIDRLPNFVLQSHNIGVRTVFGGDSVDGTADRRVYKVIYGAVIQTVTVSGEPGTGGPVMIELQYQAEQIRYYEINQPSASETLTVESTDASDTTQTVTIEDDDAALSEGVALNGTTPVATVGSFATIDAMLLDLETKGNVLIKRAGTTLATIYGRDAYNGTVGDLGIPLLGSGSHATALPGSRYQYIGSVFERGGVDLAENVQSTSFSVENALELRPRHDERKQTIIEGMRTPMLEATVFGSRESYKIVTEHLRLTESDVVWKFKDPDSANTNDLTIQSAHRAAPGEQGTPVGEVVIDRGVNFIGRGVTVPNAAV